jgi:hypothetical protein
MSGLDDREAGPVEQTDELKAELRKAFTNLFKVTVDHYAIKDKGYYGVLFCMPSKNVRNTLSIDREMLVLISTFEDQQTRTIATARALITESQGRLDPSTFIIVHMDPKGDGKLKKWGREQGLSVLPLYVGAGVPAGRDLMRKLANELFSHDPFDVTGPVADDAQFYGRREEARDLAKKLQIGQVRSVFGIRKIGKTSILHRIINEINENYKSLVVVVDCQSDDVSSLDAASLLNSIALALGTTTPGSANILVPYPNSGTIAEASERFRNVVASAEATVIIAFDEIDYITPASPTAPSWRSQFNPFWRNLRSAYQTLRMKGVGFSLIISGVSSKWFAEESIEGVENAALFFVPDEYLGPLPRGAASAMIRRLAKVAGLSFTEEVADLIAVSCADMPFWIRKACSYIHGKVEISVRPFEPSRASIEGYLDAFMSSDGTAMVEVALAHLFRVYPELKLPALSCADGGINDVSKKYLRILQKYGVVTSGARVGINGPMVANALELFKSTGDSIENPLATAANEAADGAGDAYGEWADELAILSRRRNMIERKLRAVIINFVRYAALDKTDKLSAKERILRCLDEKRRAELEACDLDVIETKLYWLELINIVKREWALIERVFGDKTRFAECAIIVNERPDAHAKVLDAADLALHRRALTWFEDRLGRI